MDPRVERRGGRPIRFPKANIVQTIDMSYFPRPSRRSIVCGTRGMRTIEAVRIVGYPD